MGSPPEAGVPNIGGADDFQSILFFTMSYRSDSSLRIRFQIGDVLLCFGEIVEKVGKSRYLD